MDNTVSPKPKTEEKYIASLKRDGIRLINALLVRRWTGEREQKSKKHVLKCVKSIA
jgi:hypothetical protein